ncbi:MAG: malonate transporter subunit MadL [Gammaproteobacteria bacterium TMED134]|jgi:malonate transporter MadL subunit|nr:MAG: malonate transporter subunit MadL [Gammaproteobacteria bacterium TMED134]RZO72740.1 MAG: malonate transporter subunit MadL [OM182 bacterium]
MVIYGVGILAASLLGGNALGNLIGQLMGIDANVGGVGIAMLLLLGLTSLRAPGFSLGPMSAQGISFWSAMYIPIVIAMAAKQNVIAAVSSGPMALLAGVAAVTVSFLAIPLIARWGSGAVEDAEQA